MSKPVGALVGILAAGLFGCYGCDVEETEPGDGIEMGEAAALGLVAMRMAGGIEDPVCSGLPPEDPPCPAAYQPCCCSTSCSYCVPEGASCDDYCVPGFCPLYVELPRSPPVVTCEVCTPECWWTTELAGHCRDPWQDAWLLTFEVSGVDCPVDCADASTSTMWQVCAAGRTVDYELLGSDGCFATVAVWGDGAITVEGHAFVGCEAYWMEETVPLSPNPACVADFDHDGLVDGEDLAVVLGGWGECPAAGCCPGEVSHDDVVDGADLAMVLAAWGGCGGR